MGLSGSVKSTVVHCLSRLIGFFIVMIARFIGGNYDLVRETLKTKAQNDAGLGLLLALCVVFPGLTANRLILAWANRREVLLGVA